MPRWRRSSRPKQKLVRYFEALPKIAIYQFVSRALLWVALMGVSKLVAWLMVISGHVALSTGDFSWVFHTWQGWTIVVVFFAALFVLTVFDVSVNILYSRQVLSDRRILMFEILRDAARTIPRFVTPSGILFVFAVALVAPLVGVGMTSTLTQNLEIPNFITEVILATPLYLGIYLVVFIGLIVVFFVYSFAMQEVVLNNKTPRQALASSRTLVAKNWTRYLPRMLYVTLMLTLAVFGLAILAISVPQLIAWAADAGQHVDTVVAIFTALLSVFIQWAAQMLALPLEVLEITRLWLCYTGELEVTIPAPTPKNRCLGIAVATACLAIGAAFSYLLALDFDELFPAQSTVQIVAHRTGGTLAPENSVAGIYKAAEKGAAGSETDVQRTADGRYVINHDDSFKRLYGNPHKVSELTFSEARHLRNSQGMPPATLDELLDAAQKTGTTLYIELKGSTADTKMADDVMTIVRAHQMVKHVVLISLKYEPLAHIEQVAPEFETGYLYFASFGDPSAFQVDDLIIEEGLATSGYVAQIHADKKRAIVWTVNTEDGLERFLASDVDAIITDEVTEAEQIKRDMPNRSPYERVYDILSWP